VRKAGLVLLSVTVLFAGAGCQSSPNRTGEGALIGGLVGAGAGAIIGNQGDHRNRDRTSGALIGGALGALGGALVGNQVQKQPQQQALSQNPNQMAMQQIVDMSRQGVNEDVIVDRIRMSNSRFSLSPGDADYLKSQGVTQKVISAMQGY
jgi:uncharacterized protein YcfJ